MSALQTLVVDDSASARTVLTRLLQRKGVQVDQTESGSQALDYLKTKKPDLIFMDHCMPGMNGLEAIKAMRSDPATASIPVVMYTSQNDEAYFQLALASGAIGIIPKPVTWNKLSEILSAVAHNRQRLTDHIAASIDQQLSALEDQLAFTLHNQMQQMGDELEARLEQRLSSLERRDGKEASHPGKGLSSLIHSVTDTKLHQLNLELRHHLTAKLDVLAQDLLQAQHQQKLQLLHEMELRLRLHQRANRPRPILPMPRYVREKWYLFPFWLALAASAALVAYWTL